MNLSRNLRNILILTLLSYVILMFGNNILTLTNPDEVFYAQTAKEMMQQKTWLVPYLFGQPQFEKPILTYWLLLIGYNMFGVSAFAARFFPALFAMIGVIAVYLLALIGYKDERKAFIAALVLTTSGLYIGLARTVFTDMIFSILILLSLATFFWAYIDRKYARMILFFIFSGLAVLAKGPLGIIIPLLAILLFLGIKKDIKFLYSGYLIWGLLIFGVIALPWYWLMIKKFGNGFIQEFFYNDHIRRLLEAEHKGNDTWYFYPLSMVSCMFPWSLAVLASFFYLLKRLKDKQAPAIYLFLSCWVIACLIVFQGAHSKLTSYIFPLFGALAIITGDFISHALNSDKRKGLAVVLLLWLTLLPMPAVLIAMTIKYPMYVTSKAGVYNFVLLFAIILAIMLFFIIKRRLSAAIHMLIVVVLLILCFTFLSHKDFGDYASSKNACGYLLNNNKVENRILCSKPFVRGVRFFTDKDVAVINVGSNNFFSPHPVPYLDSDEKVKDFLNGQITTYAIISKRSLRDIQRIAGVYRFKLDILKIMGDEYIVKINAG